MYSMLENPKMNLVKQYGKSEKDTGAAEVQIALFTHRIQYLTDHFKTHPKDNHSRRGLLKLVSKRRRMFNYLKEKSVPRHAALIKKLGLRK